MSQREKGGKKTRSNLQVAVRRRERAALRKEAAKGRTPTQQLARLDAKFGENKGAVKERLKLHMKMTIG